MNRIDFRRVDLNLMKAFDALVRSGSVTKAADELGIGQPAMSHALGRLRELFNDELFVRTSSGMLPTERAKHSILSVRRALAELESALSSETTFDATVESFQLTVGMSDYTETLLAPDLIFEFARRAPNAFIKIRQIEPARTMAAVDSGRIDIAVGKIDDTTAWHRTEVLFDDHRRCVYSKRLVGCPSPISVGDFAAQRHLVRTLGFKNTTFVDEELAKVGLARNVTASVPRFSLVPQIVKRIPLIATLPARLIDHLVQGKGMVVSDLPFDPGRFDVSMVWHATRTSDPAHEWMRDLLREVSGKLE